MQSSKWIFGALAVLPSIALAQSSVTLYGLIDNGVEYINHVGAASSGVVRMPKFTGTVPSRWGMRGTEDLGSGIKSMFVLESGFAPESGTSAQGGRLFGRQAYVGLSSDRWGQLTFGRQFTMQFWATLDSDILTSNVYGGNVVDSYRANPRADNAIGYRGKFGNITIAGTYSLGRDVVSAPAGANCAGESPADKQACRGWSAMIAYDTNTWGVSTAYESLRGGADATGGLTSSGLKDNRIIFGAYSLMNNVKVGIGGTIRDNDGSTTPHSQLYYVGAAYDLTPALNLAAQIYWLRYSHSPNKAWLEAVRATYSFSKRTSAYVTAGFIDNRGNLSLSVSSGDNTNTSPTPGGNQFGTMVGLKHVF
ncbi:porin [Cupriavidus sp. SW-Y-13]|uniref:porin n=1 Tax=Cupriavidus sp. SW-Y-13 TaxID=2653854 RepID=UPI0013661520|nr:porin [Cupriavidus sp. SW-Y-13]MWL91358.1 porin [Cupriavidus sp. SW-Y-13]